jgi:MarR family
LSSRRQVSEAVGFELRRLIAGVVLFNTAMAESLGMSPVDSQVLRLLRLEDGPATAGRLGELAHLPSSTTTRVIDRLEARGLRAPIRDASDRRRVLIHSARRRPASPKSVMRSRRRRCALRSTDCPPQS